MTRQLLMPAPKVSASRVTDLYRDSGLELAAFLALLAAARRAAGADLRCHRPKSTSASGWDAPPAGWLRVLEGLVAAERERRP